MRRFYPLAFTVLLTALAVPAQTGMVPAPEVLDVLGSVTNAARPVSNALVIALNLKDLAAIQTWSSPDGSFALSKLPAGIYKIIAVKQGFAPAVATVVPGHANPRVSLALETEKASRVTSSDEIWQIRASLPPDILHQLDMASAAPAPMNYSLPRVKGEMVSMTGVADQSAAPAFAQTSLGVESRLNGNWQLGIRGDLRRIDDPTDGESFGSAAAESSVMSMELRSSATDSYRVASTKSFWRYRSADPAAHQADVRSHDFQWKHGDARIGVRYFAQENLFASNPYGSDLLELNGGTTLLQGGRNDVGVSMRVTQENIHNSTAAPLRMADVTATGSLTMVPAFIVHYGLSSRTSLERTELAPRAGLQWKLARETSLVADGMVKSVEQFRSASVIPTVGTTFEDGRLLPRYEVSFGLVSGEGNAAHLSAIATVTAVDEPMRLLFTDGSQFWDGFYLDSGDVRRDVRISYRKDIGNKLAVDVSTSAGTATASSADSGIGNKWYLTGDVQSIFFPTGTTLLISYRELRQPQPEGLNYHSERVNVRMAQSLHLPVDLKVLLGMEVARSQNSPFLLDVTDYASNGLSRKYIGGVSVNF